MISYRIASSRADIKGIMSLQQANLPMSLSEEEAHSQGFVTLVHPEALLWAMNEAYGHTIAEDKGQLVAYALVLQRELGTQVAGMRRLLEQFATCRWAGEPLDNYRFFIMGQICVAKAYRGQGVFANLYQHLCSRMAADFELVITDVAARNSRSLHAHFKVGFVEIGRFLAEDGHEWVIIGKECRE